MHCGNKRICQISAGTKYPYNMATTVSNEECRLAHMEKQLDLQFVTVVLD